ncbi:uncharacterized protein LOC102804730 [Saccoglossus kowalevskii]|uniref:Caltractin-like n=1 Tax=Saccoglossus kowalevskii TaxID=10224 RepID=A0ABM0M2T0_SACKO|nr:PREDICTED: caltractin-like [Saccoglossus kowalevskii]
MSTRKRQQKRPRRRIRAAAKEENDDRSDILRKLAIIGDYLSTIDQKLREQLTSQEIQDLKLVFDTFDRDHKGCIDSDDLRRAMRALGFKLTPRELDEMIADLDNDQKGLVTFNDFLEFIVNKQGNARDIYDEIVQGFNMIDTDGKGHVTFDDIRTSSDEHGLWYSDVMIREMIHEADLNGDHVIDKEEFINIMLKTNLF